MCSAALSLRLSLAPVSSKHEKQPAYHHVENTLEPSRPLKKGASPSLTHPEAEGQEGGESFPSPVLRPRPSELLKAGVYRTLAGMDRAGTGTRAEETGMVRQGGILPRKDDERPPAWFSNALPGLGRRMCKELRKNHHHCIDLGILGVGWLLVKGKGAENPRQPAGSSAPPCGQCKGHMSSD